MMFPILQLGNIHQLFLVQSVKSVEHDFSLKLKIFRDHLETGGEPSTNHSSSVVVFYPFWIPKYFSVCVSFLFLEKNPYINLQVLFPQSYIFNSYEYILQYIYWDILHWLISLCLRKHICESSMYVVHDTNGRVLPSLDPNARDGDSLKNWWKLWSPLWVNHFLATSLNRNGFRHIFSISSHSFLIIRMFPIF